MFVVTRRGPLEGLLVVSIEQAVAAPYCSSRLADAGARVIKIERPEGDFARGYDAAVHGISSYFVWLNRGKQSLVADIKEAGDAALIHRILAKADVFIQNLAPGAAARSGFGSTELRAKYPRLITVDISGFGEGNEFANMKAYDLLVQAESGLAMITGRPEGPGRVGVSVCDISCGMTSYSGVLEALIDRSITGEGKSLQVSLFDGVADWMTQPLLYFEGTGNAQQRVGLAHPTICPYGAFELEDGSLVLISIQNEREWQDLCTHFLGQPDLPKQAGFDNNTARVKNRPNVDAIVATKMKTLSRASVTDLFNKTKTAFGFVNDLASLANHPALRRIDVNVPGGTASIVAPPVMDGTVKQLGPVPAVGEHSAAIHAEFAAQ